MDGYYANPTQEEVTERRRGQALHAVLDLVKQGKVIPEEYTITRMASAFEKYLEEGK